MRWPMLSAASLALACESLLLAPGAAPMAWSAARGQGGTSALTSLAKATAMGRRKPGRCASGGGR
eukprot:7364555-Heterocapsa_arctica.AAC.1